MALAFFSPEWAASGEGSFPGDDQQVDIGLRPPIAAAAGAEQDDRLGVNGRPETPRHGHGARIGGRRPAAQR